MSEFKLSVLKSIVVAALIFSVIIGGVYYLNNSGLFTAKNNSSLQPEPLPSCLQLIPTGSKVTSILNSTMNGMQIAFPNGTDVLYPSNQCPQPVLPGAFQIFSEIENNSIFIAAENHSSFIPDTFGLVPNAPAPFQNISSSSYTLLYFYHLGTVAIHPFFKCLPPRNSDDIYYPILGVIAVYIPNPPVSQNSSLTNLIIQVSGPQDNWNCGS